MTSPATTNDCGRRTPTRLGDFAIRRARGPVAVFVVGTAVLVATIGTEPPVMLIVQLCVSFAAAFLVMAAVAALRGFDAPWTWVVVGFVVSAIVAGCVSVVIAAWPDWTELRKPLSVLDDWLVGAGWGAFFVGLSLVFSGIRVQEHRIANAEQQVLTARLDLLTAQIEPHFLMNTLANIRVLIRSDPTTASRMLENLAGFLEGSLERSRGARATLGDEVALVSNYLAIMRIRFGDRISYSIEVPPSFHGVRFPPLLLQTLVENAVVHGLQPLGRAGTVTVTAVRSRDSVKLTVEDDGVGFPHGVVGDGVGLQNSRARLATYYGDHGGRLELFSKLEQGTKAIVTIPWEPAR